MTSFIETRFPDTLSFGAQGGPGYLTNVVEVQGGYEYRDAIWSRGRGRWDVAVNATRETNAATILAFFHAMKGRAYGFRFKDWSDYKDGGSGLFTPLTSTTFQMVKRYTAGSQSTDRVITKPVSGTIAITGGVSASLDYTTGIVTVASGTPTAWTGQFDVPVRFDIDRLEAELLDGPVGNRIIGFHSVPIIEIRPQ